MAGVGGVPTGSVITSSIPPGIVRESGPSVAVVGSVGVATLGEMWESGMGLVLSGCGSKTAWKFVGADETLGRSRTGRCTSLDGVLRGFGIGNWLTRIGSAWTIVGSVGSDEEENVKESGALNVGDTPVRDVGTPDVDDTPNTKGDGIFASLRDRRVGGWEGPT